MKTVLSRLTTSVSFTTSMVALLAATSAAHRANAADRTWNGGGSDNNWSTPANWGGTAPAAGDVLFFGGSVRTSPFNDFPAGTLFSGITINNGAGLFGLRGNSITLGGDLVDNMALVPQTNLLTLSLNATRTVNVVADGLLTLGGAISGAGAGLTKAGDGQLTLTSPNTFSGPVRIFGGTLSIASDANLGAVPAAAEAGRIVIQWPGALRTTSTLTLNPNRGITVGSAGLSGRLTVNSGTTLTYSGRISDNGQGAGLTKNGFGGLTLSGANTYTGGTEIQNGTVTLEFGQAGAPANNIISSSSALRLGGANAGLGAASFDALIMNGAGAANSQTFNGTTIDIGPAIIRANSGGGSATMNLGSLTHTAGGILNVITPTATGGAGRINTTTPNLNGILGGWATVGNGGAFNNITMGTEWASVDGSGNIVPYTDYRVFQTGEALHGIATAGTNLRINSTSTGDVIVDALEAGTITDLNTINLSETRAFSIVVGNNNTLRLGRFGSIFKSDNANNITWALGSGTTGGANGTQDQGALTAGGAPDTPGEIVFYMNNGSSQSQGSLNVEARVTDNGSGAVTLVKAGPASMKLRGHNTFSGGLILLQGRLQFAGSEIGTGNPDGGGTGLIYVYPGAYIFPSGAGDFGVTGVAISNNFFVAGLGTQQEQVGAIRFGNGTRIAGDVTLIGDSRLGGGNAATLPNTGISGKISGPFNLDIGALGTINTFISLFNPANDWTGATTFNARNTATANSVRNGASEVIPNGVGRGNVTLNGNTSTGTITWDLSGFNETINGLLSAGNLAGCIIVNNVSATTSTLTVGDYDQTATFGGSIQNGASGAGIMALTKIGGGRQTLTGVNTYTGDTTINGGTLAVSGSGSIAASQHILVNGGTLDVSEVAGGFTHAFPVDINNGSLGVRSTAFPGIASLSLTDSRVRVTSLGATPIAVETSGLSTGGQTNLIDIASVGAIAGYPVQFTIIKYAGAIGGAGFNFGLGAVPTASTVGFISNNVDNSSVDVVLLDGPKTLTWTGTAGPAWDINNALNWLAFGATPSVFLDVDSVRFDDTAAATTVNLTTTLQPGSVLVNNTALDYTFTGAGKISGPGGLTKEGAGTLILDNAGTNDFFGPTTINGGAVQVGNGDANGSLGAGNVINNASLVFARSDAVTVANVISGAGTLTQNSPGVLTLGGESVFTGPTVVAQGTLRPGGPSAFGTVDGATTVSSGATLDVNGQSLGAEPINVSGSGAGGNGAIINSGAEQLNALRTVTLTGDTTLGGTSRWDIRNTGGAAALSSGGAAYNLTKTGPNQVSLVGVAVDAALGDITIHQGLLGFETSTTSMGDPARTLTVEPGASLSFFNSTALWEKRFMLQGNGIIASVTNWSGLNTMTGPVTLNGDCVWGVAGTALVCNGTISGSGSLIKQGAAPLILAGLGDYAGLTIVSNGTLFVDGSLQSGGDVRVNRGTLAGVGVVGPSVTIGANGNLSPGNPANSFAVLQLGNNLTLAGTCTIDLNKSANPLIHDVIVFVSDMTFGGTLRLNISGPELVDGDEFVFFNFVTATGAFSRIEPASPGSGLGWDTSRLAIDGTLRVVALPTPGIAGISIVDHNVVFNGTNGLPGTSSYVLGTTNVALPLANWVRIATNVFDANGNFNFTNTVNPNTPQQFFLLQLP